MPPSFSLELVGAGESGRLYAFRFTDDADELTRFLDREDGTTCTTDQRRDCHENLDFQTCRHRCGRYEFRVRLEEYFDLGLNDGGFLDDFFARKDRYPYPVGSLKSGRYRLYGVHYGPDLFIAGDGGVKLVPTIQDDPVLLGRYERVRAAARRLDTAVRRHCGQPESLPRDANGIRHLPDSLLSFD